MVAQVILVSHDDHSLHYIEIDVLEARGVGNDDVGVVKTHLVELCVAPYDVVSLAMLFVGTPSATAIFAFPLLWSHWSAGTSECHDMMFDVHEMHRNCVDACALLRISIGHLGLRAPNGVSKKAYIRHWDHDSPIRCSDPLCHATLHPGPGISWARNVSGAYANGHSGRCIHLRHMHATVSEPKTKLVISSPAQLADGQLAAEPSRGTTNRYSANYDCAIDPRDQCTPSSCRSK